MTTYMFQLGVVGPGGRGGCVPNQCRTRGADICVSERDKGEHCIEAVIRQPRDVLGPKAVLLICVCVKKQPKSRQKKAKISLKTFVN